MSEKRIPIFYACDQNFVRYTVVSLYSMMQNARKEYSYDVFVLHTGISEETMKILTDMRSERWNTPPRATITANT